LEARVTPDVTPQARCYPGRPFCPAGGLVDATGSRENGAVAQHETELILARPLAGGLAVPILLVDARGDTLYFNEPAELLFGRRFDDIDVLPFEARTSILSPRYPDGRPMPVEELPGMRAMRDRRPAHSALYMHGLDGVLRPVQATAIPLESSRGQLLGALVVLWAHDDHTGEGSAGP
jgi:hypothetical protein